MTFDHAATLSSPNLRRTPSRKRDGMTPERQRHLRRLMAILTWGGIVLSCALLGLTILAEAPIAGHLDPLAFLSPAAMPQSVEGRISAARSAHEPRFPRFARPASAAPVRLADRYLPKDRLPIAKPSMQPAPASAEATHLFAAPMLTASATLRPSNDRDRLADPEATHLFAAPMLTASATLRPSNDRDRLADPMAFVTRVMPAASDGEPVATVAGELESEPAAHTQLASIEPDRSPSSMNDELEIATPPSAIVKPTWRPAAPARAIEAIAAVRRLPAARQETPVLAYARPDAGEEPQNETPSVGVPLSLPGRGSGTAIYDIEAATVYLPNGEKLEAHSGLGALRDDPRFAHTRNRGVTPPHTYNLTLRESLFHGVQAIRLHPVGGERNIHNRNGLLAHTYMLGPRGDSNGCVSFKDYKRFLAAFRRGEVRRLVVVARLANPASRFARFFASKG